MSVSFASPSTVVPVTTRSLREGGAIVLISTYELGHQPLTIASAAAFLKRAGYSPAVHDVAVESLDPAQIARARVVAISVPMHTALRVGVLVAERVRAIHPECQLCFFGLYAGVNAAHLFASHGANFVISGEFEAPLVALMDALDADADPAVPGVSTPARVTGPHLARLDFPVPDRSALPSLARYAHIERDGERHLAGYTEASRGCIHRCLHCPIPLVYDGRFFIVPEPVVMADARQLVAMGARHISFGDPDFLNAPTHALRVAYALHEEFPEVTYDFTAKIEHILEHRELLASFAATGCIYVVTAVESWSDLVLAKLEKGHTRADISVAIESLRTNGIAPRPSLVAFTPWASIDDYVEQFEIVERSGLVDHIDPVQYTIRLLIPPGSSLMSPQLISNRARGIVAAKFASEWSHPDPRMDVLHKLVSARVEAGIAADEDSSATFQALHGLAIAMRDGHAHDGLRARTEPVASRARPPRLTEPWFC